MWYLLYCWLICLLVTYFTLDISIFVFLILIVCGYSLFGFIILELYFIIVLMYIVSSSTMERFGAEWYLGYFSIVVGIILIIFLDVHIISLLLMIVILSNLPLYGLHMWLPNVHVEASLFGSVFLAAVILKAGSMFFYISSSVLSLMLLIIIVSLSIVSYVDGKGIVAISSVVHISISVLTLSVVWISGYSHILVSALLFLAVYLSYNDSGSRISWSMSPMLLLVNLSFPFLGGFVAELVLSNLFILLFFGVYYYFAVVFILNLYIRSDYRSISWGYTYLFFAVFFVLL